jgi:hypothetical protein
MRTMTRTGALLAGAALATALLSGCGASSTATSAAAPAAATATGGGTGKAAYDTCLEQHGVTLPSHAPGQGKPSAGSSKDPQVPAAASACASLRPAGGGTNRGGTALTAFRACMAQQGAAIPTAKASPTPSASSPDARYLNGLNPSDPAVAAALAACGALLPTHSPKASSSASS